MPSNKTQTAIAIIAVFFAFSLAKDANAGTKTITVPEETKVVKVESTYCEPIYNEHTGTLYVPGCWKDKQEREQTYGERTVDRTIDRVSTEAENSVNNVIDRVIYEMGEKIETIGGNR